MAITRSKWFLPAFCVAAGAVSAVAFLIGDDRENAIGVFVALSVFGGLVLLGGRFDLVRGLRGDGRDEYWARIDIHATALAGHVLIALILGLCIWEWSHGRDGTPYVWLGGAAGVAYLVSVGLLRWRS